MLMQVRSKALCAGKCLRNAEVLMLATRSSHTVFERPVTAAGNLSTNHQQRRRASLVCPRTEESCLGPIPRRKLAKAARDFARVVMERLTKTETCPSKAKSYSQIPGPRGIPFLGSVLEYTAIGRFSPKEFHKALRHRHTR